jgi:hypothetical protein
MENKPKVKILVLGINRTLRTYLTRTTLLHLLFISGNPSFRKIRKLGIWPLKPIIDFKNGLNENS